MAPCLHWYSCVYIPLFSQESLVQSEETASAIREKSEAALKKLEEEKASMSEEMAQLEVRLQKALEQRKESMVKDDMHVPHIYGMPGKHLNNSLKGILKCFLTKSCAYWDRCAIVKLNAGFSLRNL